MSDVEKTSLQDIPPVQHSEPVHLSPFRRIYYNPYTQVCLLGLVCFMCPGLFNALTGLGGAGRVDGKTAANANAALYALFAGMAFFAGTVNNKLGPRMTLLLGATGYSIYIGSFLATNIHSDAGGFAIAAGVILGICAGLLWTAQGSLMMAYPTEAQKGRFVAIFWAIFNLGGVVGAAVSLGQNIHNTGNSVGNGTYIGFLVLTLIGILIPLLMADPNKMIRTDGSKVTTQRHPSWKVEFKTLWVALHTDPAIVSLFPLFFASNWFYTWQFNDYNGAIFDIAARSLNNFVYWTSQIVGAIAMGTLLDTSKLSRKKRALLGWGVLLVMVFVVHIWGYEYQKQYTRESVAPANDPHKIGIHDKGYAGRIWLYIFCGLLDAMWQTNAYWLMGAMSNDAAKLAYFTGFYKSIQSAGGAGAWRADGVGIPFMNIFISTWVLLAVGLVSALPMIIFRVKDHTELEDEVIARMDDAGVIHQADEYEQKA